MPTVAPSSCSVRWKCCFYGPYEGDCIANECIGKVLEQAGKPVPGLSYFNGECPPFPGGNLYLPTKFPTPRPKDFCADVIKGKTKRKLCRQCKTDNLDSCDRIGHKKRRKKCDDLAKKCADLGSQYDDAPIYLKIHEDLCQGLTNSEKALCCEQDVASVQEKMEDKVADLMSRWLEEVLSDNMLDLRGRRVDDELLTYILQVISSSKAFSKLRQLDLEENYIGNPGGKILADALDSMPYLRRVYLGGNSMMTSVGKKALRLAAKKHPNVNFEIYID